MYSRFGDGRVGVLQLQRGHESAPRFVCFAHAGGGPRAFAPLTQALPNAWRVTALEPPGRVSTAGDPVACAKQLAALYLELLSQDFFRNAILVGHSVGGYVALALAELLRHRVRGLVVAASTPPTRERTTADFATIADAELLRWAARLHDVGGAGTSSDANQFWLRSLRADLVAFQRFTGVNYGALQSIPTLLCGGVNDILCPPASFGEWSVCFPNSTIRWLPGGHFFVQTHANHLAREMRSFVAQTVAQP